MIDGDGADGWDAVLDDLARRRSAARAMGGEERLAKHRAAGKLDVRARIDHLLDPGSFLELGTLVGGADAPADAIVIGSGTIDDRPVLVGAEDFTVKAGTISGPSNSKRHRIAELAVTDRVPLVMLLEGAGYRADGRHYGRAPTDLLAQARCSGRVPLVTAVLGAVGGPRRAGGADVGLRGDERRGIDLHRRPAGGATSRWGRRSPRRSSAAPAWPWPAASCTTSPPTTPPPSTSCAPT